MGNNTHDLHIEHLYRVFRHEKLIPRADPSTSHRGVSCRVLMHRK